MRIGALGLDSSHALQFTRRFHDLHARGKTPCHVSLCWDIQSPLGLSEADIHFAADSLRPFGVRRATSLEELLASVDAVMVLTKDGHRHHDLATSALSRGLPTFIDKPLTCSAAEAASLLECSRRHAARCYSASSLRFTRRVPADQANLLGPLVSIEATGPVQETAHMSGLWYYGCHTFELVDSLWLRGGGICRVRAHCDASRYHIELAYRDGRTSVIGLDRSGTSPFVVRLHGTISTSQFTADLSTSYDELIAGMACFFAGNPPPVPLKDIVETIKAIDCCHQSIAVGGTWVELQ